RSLSRRVHSAALPHFPVVPLRHARARVPRETAGTTPPIVMDRGGCPGARPRLPAGSCGQSSTTTVPKRSTSPRSPTRPPGRAGGGRDGHAVGDERCGRVAAGGYAEKVVVPAGQVMPVPSGVALPEAATLREVACTVWSNPAMVGGLGRGSLAGDAPWGGTG